MPFYHIFTSDYGDFLGKRAHVQQRDRKERKTLRRKLRRRRQQGSRKGGKQ